MNNYTLKQNRLPLDDSWDVIVAGGGPAGCAAAAASARAGAKTLLIEATSMLGGMGTAGLVPWFCGYDDGEKHIARGLAEHVSIELAKTIPHPAIDPEALKSIYDNMVTGEGASVLFLSNLCAVETSDSSTVDAIITANKSGLCAFRAKVYVDCTGDGDLAAWAGAAFEKGDASGAMQPGTHCFMISNIDEAALAKGPAIHFYDQDSPIWRIIKDDKYPLIEELHACSMKIGPGVRGFNTGHVFGVDNTDPASISSTLLKGRQMARQYRDGFAEYHPAFAKSFLAATGSLMGIRETRRITCDYKLTVEDYLAARRFPDEICLNAYGIDVHGSRENALALAKKSIPELKEFNRKLTRQLPKGQSVGVPLRCLLPAGLRNVIVAGRCICADREAYGSVRIMACCLNTGEAAGIAAAIAAAGAADVHAVNADEVRAALRAHGAWLP